MILEILGLSLANMNNTFGDAPSRTWTFVMPVGLARVEVEGDLVGAALDVEALDGRGRGVASTTVE